MLLVEGSFGHFYLCKGGGCFFFPCGLSVES